MKLEPISKSEAARYMGVKGQPDGQVMELLDCAEPIIRENISPKYVYRETALRIDDSGVHAEGMGADCRLFLRVLCLGDSELLHAVPDAGIG